MAQQNQDAQSARVDKAQAAERAKQKENGRVLRVDQSRNKYRVKVLKKSGRVVSVDVDKRSGQVQSPQDKDSDR
nr:PepSY domain-containing protein [Alteromonas pelagimontana]